VIIQPVPCAAHYASSVVLPRLQSKRLTPGTAVLTELRIRELLQPFGVMLDTQRLAQVQTYLDLLLRWNRKINLTSIRDPEQIITRHFGECLFIQSQQLTGKLLDIGSGAGFPGLALKIVFPALPSILLEPIAKKRAFLKEVTRCCHFDEVEVRPERLEDMVHAEPGFTVATARAVGPIDKLAKQSSRVLMEGGRLFLWTTWNQVQMLGAGSGTVTWAQRLSVPLSRERVILIGVREEKA
jgi:16S rRNA (guanine527-N7)-methyltransferase